MPYRASIARAHGAEPYAPSIATNRFRLVAPPLLATLHIGECVRNLRNNGFQDFLLCNGARGRFIYREDRRGGVLQGFCLSFALQETNGNGCKAYGRIALAAQKLGNQLLFFDGYDYIGLQPQNSCAELKDDLVDAVLVSPGLREEYAGIGSALVALSAGIGAAEGATGIKILQSISAGTDRFYEKAGFRIAAEGQWVYDLGPAELERPLSPVLPRRAALLGSWRPKEEAGPSDWKPVCEVAFPRRLINSVFGLFS